MTRITQPATWYTLPQEAADWAAEHDVAIIVEGADQDDAASAHVLWSVGGEVRSCLLTEWAGIPPAWIWQDGAAVPRA